MEYRRNEIKDYRRNKIDQYFLLQKICSKKKEAKIKNKREIMSEKGGERTAFRVTQFVFGLSVPEPLLSLAITNALAIFFWPFDN